MSTDCQAGAQAARRDVVRALVRDIGGNTVPPSPAKVERLEGRIAEFAGGARKQGFGGATLAGARLARVPGPRRAGTIAVFREAGRGGRVSARIEPGTATVFDRRLRIVADANGGDADGDGMTVSCGVWSAPARERFPAAARAAVAMVERDGEPVFALCSQQASRAGVHACCTGVRFGRFRLVPGH